MSIGIWALCSLARFCRFCLAAASARGRPHRRGGGALQLGGGPTQVRGRRDARAGERGHGGHSVDDLLGPVVRPGGAAVRLCGRCRRASAWGRRVRCDRGFRAPGFQTGQNGGVPTLRGRGAGGVHAAQRGGWRRFGAAALLRHGRGDIRTRLGASRHCARRLRRLALSWLRLGRGQAVRAAWPIAS